MTRPRSEREATKPLRRSVEIETVELDGELVVYDERTDRIHHLNATATILWHVCDGTATVDDLIDDISHSFGVDADVVGKQVRGALDELRTAGLLDTPQQTRAPRAHPHRSIRSGGDDAR